MAGPFSQTNTEPTKALPPLPLDSDNWASLARTLDLAPQQERIVELILRGMQDKEIAAELGLKVPTVRTYLRRTYLRLGVEDRMKLVLKLFAASHQEAFSDCRHSR